MPTKNSSRLSPWDTFQSWDVEQWGEVIQDQNEQRRWSQAIFLGGLVYMWGTAGLIKESIYTKMRLRPGDRVLVIGEVIEPCGFADDIRERIGPDGELHVVEIVEEARRAYLDGLRGRGGQLATWEWTYSRSYPDAHFDSVAVLQGVQHTDDWSELGAELARVLKPGGQLALGEISFGPRFEHRAQADIHISYLLDKIFDRMGLHFSDFPYYSEEDLHQALDPLYLDTGHFEWRGVEMFWGRKAA